jgi:hypothetical protein
MLSLKTDFSLGDQSTAMLTFAGTNSLLTKLGRFRPKSSSGWQPMPRSRIRPLGTKASAFYAQHSTLVNTLGGAALIIALAKVAERQKAA